MKQTTIDPLVLHFFYEELEKDAGLGDALAIAKGVVNNAVIKMSPTFAGHMASGNLGGMGSTAIGGVGRTMSAVSRDLTVGIPKKRAGIIRGMGRMGTQLSKHAPVLGTASTYLG